MGSNSNVLNASRLLFMILFSAVLFNSLFANADGETFKLSKNNTSAKALVGEKKFEANVTFIASDYTDKEDRSFSLSVGGCKLSVKARKDQDSGAIEFKFSNGKDSKKVDNPKSFSTEGQRLIFYDSDGINKVYVDCNQEISFVPIEGGEFYLEVSTEGEILGLILSSNNAVYYPPEKASYAIWIVIGAVSGSLFLLVVSIVVGVCIFKCRKKKADAKKKPDAILMAVPIVEESKLPVANEVSAEQKPTSDVKPSTSTTKTTEPPQIKKQASVVDVGKKAKAADSKAKNGQTEKTSKAKNDRLDKAPKVKEALKTAVEFKPKVETKPAPSKQVVKPPTPMHKSVTEVKPDKKKDSKTEAKVKPKTTVQNAPRNRLYHTPEDEESEVLSDVDKPDKISPSVSVKVALSNESKTKSKNSTTEACSCTTTLEEVTAKSMDSTQESSKRSTLKSLASTQETSSKRSITGDSKTVE